ncbi:NAD(P)-dependent alcohol dehydrogenase [Meiothermus sp.]|uniref:NAD(P)-dependent alcohol dehydrogenase n=1 Tax=Meiothermus sp. TaxID=1955249 RepID=UPI0021DE7185|nr:NAD(P)-dependent alcohol dehydrogenase [Meiothermus sp.]GIW25236.1 MAG: NADPH:quinone reductase [Meiothermus sp.]
MKAITYEQYGQPEVLQFKEVEKPVPKDNEVLVKVRAASLNAYDWHILTADIFLVRLNRGLFKPKIPILGADIAGEVEAVGKEVRRFKPGDAVFGSLASGGFAEYACAPEKVLAPKPANLTFEAAAAVPMAALTALQALRDAGGLQAGQKVLIHGAAGGVGTFAVQLAKLLGAEVTAVSSSRNLEQSRQLGADYVIDYTQEDFAQKGQLYDLILGVNGYRPLSVYRRALAPNGRYVMIGGTPSQIFQALLLGPWMSRKGQKMGNMLASIRSQDLDYLKERLEAGQLVPVIDRRYTLAETADALRYLGSGHARGKVVIAVG